MGIFAVGIGRADGQLVLTGEVDRAEARLDAMHAAERAGLRAADQITVLPAAELGDKLWAIATLSVANGREQPDHKAEMGTQILMGQVVRVWKQTQFWSLVQSPDGYLSWVEKGALVRCDRQTTEGWKASPLVIVTACEDCVRESPQPQAQPVSDVVMGDLLKAPFLDGDWLGVELPDGRTGFLRKLSATNYAAWKTTRRATPENIEDTARLFLGRPYLWGGCSPKGLDCSGFAKMVFFLNGIELNRNANEQARQGVEVTMDGESSQLKKGDLLFFGGRGRRGQAEWVTHVAIYLDYKRFIQSSQRVKISSLDPSSPLYDEHHARRLLFARRILPETPEAHVEK